MSAYVRSRSRRLPHSPALSPNKRPRLYGPSLAVYGNYCGPNWSAGKYQGSVRGSSVPAIDSVDNLCLIHDGAYATPGSNLRDADLNFMVNQVLTGNPIGIGMGAAVGVQGIARSLGLLPVYNASEAPIVRIEDLRGVIFVRRRKRKRRVRRLRSKMMKWTHNIKKVY